MSFRKNRRIRFAVVGKARNAFGVWRWLLYRLLVARLALLLAYLLARLLLCLPFWANFALLGSLARLLPRRFVILSGVR